MAKGKPAARKSTRAVSTTPADLVVDYNAFPDSAKGRAMARQAARRARDEKTAKKGGADEPFVVSETAEGEA